MAARKLALMQQYFSEFLLMSFLLAYYWFIGGIWSSHTFRGWEIASLFNLGVATFVNVITIGHRVINGDPSFFISETVLKNLF